MKRVSLVLAVALVSAVLLAVPAPPASAVTGESPALWITATDGTGDRITYNVSPEGLLLASFPTPSGATSSIAVDPTNRSLWGANESFSGGQGRLVNYDRNTGASIGTINAELFDGVGTEGVALTLAPGDSDTLWVATDPDGGGQPRIYHIRRDGSLISSFETAIFDPSSRSPQAIAYDPFTASLWVTDNSTETIYNITPDGGLITSFSTLGFGVTNIQGISVESPEVLWVTARDTDRVYRISAAGTSVLSSFEMGAVEFGAFDPTGVAFERPPGYLGAAATLGVLGLPGAKLKIQDVDEFTGVVGDVALGSGARQDFRDGLITGTYAVDPGGDDSNFHSVIISGGTVSADLGPAVADAQYASLAASVLVPSQSFGEIKDTTDIIGQPGLNVIEITKVELDGNESLTLYGDHTSSFILNVREKFKLKNDSAIVLAGGLTPDKVLINYLGTDDAAIESRSVATGTILTPNAKFKIKDRGSTLVGAVIGGDELKLESGGRLRVLTAVLAPGDLGVAGQAAVLALPGAKVRIDDVDSLVSGDVALGPFAKQDFSEGQLDGSLIVDNFADNGNTHGVLITGPTTFSDLSPRVADAVDASDALARLTPDQWFSEIKEAATIAGVGDLTVVQVDKIELDGNETLEIFGGPTSTIVVNVTDRLKLKGSSSVVLSGGVLAENVVFNVLSSGDVAVEEGSSLQGIVLAIHADRVKVKELGSTVIGAVIGGGEIVVEKGGVVAAS